MLIDEQALRDRSPSLFQFNEKLLQDPNRLYQFKKFVETEYADEHLSFYLVSGQGKGKAACTAPIRSHSRAPSARTRAACFFCSLFFFEKDVSQWRQLQSEAARRQRADEILTTYVRPGAEKLINIEERHLKQAVLFSVGILTPSHLSLVKGSLLWHVWRAFSFRQTQAMAKSFQDGNYKTLFDTAMDEVFKLMKLDSYQRFSRSVFFQAMLTGTAVKEDAFGEEVFVKFMELCTGRDQPWTPLKKKNEAESFEQQTADGHQLLKAVCEVRGTPAAVAAILVDAAKVPLWDKECLGSYELERFSDRFSTVYVAYKGSMMGASQTDFVLAQILREFSDGTVCIICRSLPNGHELVPEKKGFMRCRTDVGGWMLEKLEGEPPRTRITSIQEVDYSGAGKANKRTMDAAKARIIAIAGLREFVASYRPKEERRKSLII